MNTEKQNWIELANVTDSAADLFIYGPIGEPEEAASVLSQLRALKVATINMRINSPGGSVFGGLAVYNTLNGLEAKIVSHVDGLAASIASVIAMAGDEIVMAGNAMLLIHNPSASTQGNAQDHRAQAVAIDKIGESLAAIYVSRSGLAPEKVAEIMAGETWLTASEALALGLCTSVSGDKKIAASFDLSAFKNVPASASVFTVTTEGTAPIAEAFTAEIVAERVRAAAESAHAAAKTALDAAKAEALAASNEMRAKFTTEIGGLRDEIQKLTLKLREAEQRDAANLGVPPVAIAIGATAGAASKVPGAPAEILAHWRSLAGKARGDYFAANSVAIWAAHDAEMRSAS